GEAVPGGVGLTGKVVCPPGQLARLFVAASQRKQAVGDAGRRCGGALLVGDDAQGSALAREAQHGFYEVVAVMAEDPTGAKNDVPVESLAHRLLTGQLAVA